jgi:hypothetical protein
MGAVKELLSKGPDMEELIWWAKQYILPDYRKEYPEIKRYAEEFDMTVEQFKSLCNLYLHMGRYSEDEEDVLREIIYYINKERTERKIKNNDTMKESILMPSFQELKEGENKKMKGEDPCWDGYEMVGTKKKDGKEVPNCVKANENLNEDHHKECSDEVSMAKIQLKSIMADAGELLQSLDQCEQLDAWVQSKISVAEDYITTVNKYMKFEEESAPEELPLIPQGPGPEVIDEIPAENPEEDPEPMVEPIEPVVMDMEDIEMPPMGPNEAPEIEDLELFSK